MSGSTRLIKQTARDHMFDIDLESGTGFCSCDPGTRIRDWHRHSIHVLTVFEQALRNQIAQDIRRKTIGHPQLLGYSDGIYDAADTAEGGAARG